MKKAIWVLALLAVAGLWAQNAEAYTVAGWGTGGFADFSKAIVFTGSCPSNGETIAANGGAKTCAIPMRPVGDGSWTCTATVIKGIAYAYYFEYRIPIFDSTTVYSDSQSTYAWRNSAAPTGTRDQDPVKGVTVPNSAQEGYMIYNIFGDNTVRGTQGIGKTGSWDTELTVANPYIARYQGVDDIDNTTDNDTGNLNSSNNFGMTATQSSDTTIVLSWSLGHGGDGFAPSVEGSKEFDTKSATPQYGFKILRARITAANGTTAIKNLIFEDTVVNQVRGDTFYSPTRASHSGGWYSSAVSFTDTSLPADVNIGDTFIYAVLWQDAYGNRNDTADQDFSGGNSTFVRAGFVDVIFMVERFDPGVVFPDGSTSGTLYLTPYVNGVPMPFNSIRATAVVASKKAAG